MPTAKLRSKGQLTLPSAIRKAAHLKEGDCVDVLLHPAGILLLQRERIDPDQAWFWTPEWQEGEREADEDIAAGRVIHFESGEEFLAALEALGKQGE